MKLFIINKDQDIVQLFGDNREKSMPAMVGGFGNINNIKSYIVRTFKYINDEKKIKIILEITSNATREKINNLRRHGPYLAGLIEGDGTFAIKDVTTPVESFDKSGSAKRANKYNPHIIVVFKIGDTQLANFLCSITGCGKVYTHTNRNYVLWQIQNIRDVFVIVSVINGYIRTPKVETLGRYIVWYNNYINSAVPLSIPGASYIKINDKESMKVSGLRPAITDIMAETLTIIPIDNSPIASNSWLSGFVDADGHFAISITKRSNGKIRVITRFSLEQRQNYHRDTGVHIKTSYSSIILAISELFNGGMYARSRTLNDKVYYSFVVIAFSAQSKDLVISYFDRYPLRSSKYNDYMS